jgi:hypothetical protein
MTEILRQTLLFVRTLVAVTEEYETVLVVFDEQATLRVKKTSQLKPYIVGDI